MEQRFWQRSIADALAATASTPSGISAAEAAARLAANGPNSVAARRRRSLPLRVLKKLAEPLVAILIIAAAVSGLSGDWASFVIILVVVLMSIALDVAQETRAEAAADALKRSVAVRAEVIRDGVSHEIPVEALVVGDVVRLAAGDLVPADGIVLSAHALHVNEALLTGEPYAVEKGPATSSADTPAEAANALFAGTSVISGEATALILATGRATEFGAIAADLSENEAPSAFERGVHQLGMLILRLTVFLTLFVLLAHLAFHRPPLESFLFAVALAVGLTPELLPMVVTVTLSRGALRMAAKRVIVKRLAAIHDLGAMTVLCTDKTGTLTEARIALVGSPGPDGADRDRVIELAAVNSRFETGIRSSLDEAILARADATALAAWVKIDDVPFDFDRRRVSVLVERAGERLIVVKGAPEEIVARATAIEGADGSPMPIDAERRAALVALHDARAAEGFRLLGVAWRRVEAERAHIEAADEADLVFAGFCVFVDPPKASAGPAVGRLRAAGVRVKIISGDAAAVVRHLVATLSLPAHGLMTGEEIAGLDDIQLAARVGAVDLYARVSPDQKMRIIRALRARGETVGFMGDGVNDAPAIRAADVGLSVDGATDVAREAADMILLDQDLSVLADGVDEGRRTFANIIKYVRMGTSSNFGNMLSMALASLVIPFLPLTPVQILINNLIYDLSEIGIPFDAVGPEETARPQAWDMRGLLAFTLIMGTLSSVFDAATFAILRLVYDAAPSEFQTAWFVESMATQILVIFVIRTARPFWADRPNPILTITSLGGLAAAVALALGPWGAWFGFSALPAGLLATIVALVAVYFGLAEVLKRWALRHTPARHHRTHRRSQGHGHHAGRR